VISPLPVLLVGPGHCAGTRSAAAPARAGWQGRPWDARSCSAGCLLLRLTFLQPFFRAVRRSQWSRAALMAPLGQSIGLQAGSTALGASQLPHEAHLLYKLSLTRVRCTLEDFGRAAGRPDSAVPATKRNLCVNRSAGHDPDRHPSQIQAAMRDAQQCESDCLVILSTCAHLSVCADCKCRFISSAQLVHRQHFGSECDRTELDTMHYPTALTPGWLVLILMRCRSALLHGEQHQWHQLPQIGGGR